LLRRTQGICEAVERVLAMPLQQRAALGAAARASFLDERSRLLEAMARVRGLIEVRLKELQRADGAPKNGQSRTLESVQAPPQQAARQDRWRRRRRRALVWR
jgi:hypothetical protein